jgi:hypothetical protein
VITIAVGCIDEVVTRWDEPQRAPTGYNRACMTDPIATMLLTPAPTV